MNQISSESSQDEEASRNALTQRESSLDISSPHSGSKKKMESTLKKVPKKNKKKNSLFFSDKNISKRLNKIKSREEIEKINEKTSQQVIKSVYSLISSKFPLTIGTGELSEKDQDEIQGFFLKKKNEFQKALEGITQIHKSSGEKLRSSKVRSVHSEERYLKELMVMKEKQRSIKKDLIRRANEKVNQKKKLQKKQLELEINKKQREVKKKLQYEKEMIIKNIENFYQDRIVIIKDHLQKEQEIRKIQDYDEKKRLSSIIKEQKEIRLQNLSNLKIKYELKLEKLKHQLDSI